MSKFKSIVIAMFVVFMGLPMTALYAKRPVAPYTLPNVIIKTEGFNYPYPILISNNNGYSKEYRADDVINDGIEVGSNGNFTISYYYKADNGKLKLQPITFNAILTYDKYQVQLSIPQYYTYYKISCLKKNNAMAKHVLVKYPDEERYATIWKADWSWKGFFVFSSMIHPDYVYWQALEKKIFSQRRNKEQTKFPRCITLAFTQRNYQESYSQTPQI